MAPAKLPRIRGENTRRVATVDSPLQQRNSKLVVMRQVELKKKRTGESLSAPSTVTASGFWRPRRPQSCLSRPCSIRKAAEVDQRPWLLGARPWELALGMVNLVDPDRCEANWCGDFMSTESCRGVPLIDVNKLLRNDSVPEERLSIGKVSPAISGIGLGVEATVDGK